MKIFKTLLLTTLATNAIADTTLVFNDKKDKVNMKMQFANNMMRATSVGDDSSYMVFNAKDITFTTFMTEKKEYFVMDKQTIEKLGDVGAMMQDMIDKQLADMPEAQRDMMRGMIEKMVKSQMPKEAPKADYKFTGKSSSYNGFDCEIVKKKLARKKSEFCVTEYSNIGMSASEYSVISSFQKTVEKLAQKYGQDHSMEFSSLGDYIPVKFNQAGEAGILKDVNHDKLDAQIFAIPEGYSKMDLPF